MTETKKSRGPMKVPTKKALKDKITLLEQENTALNVTVENLWAWRAELHQNIMDTLQANRYAFASAETLSQVAHLIGHVIRNEVK